MSAPLDIRELSVALGGRTVLRDVDLSLEPGVLTGLVGPNGAGKSTLLRAAMNLVPARLGQVSMGGEPVSALTSRERARRAAYLPQSRSSAWNVRGVDIAALGRFAWGGAPFERLSTSDRAVVERTLARAEADGFAHRPIGELSGGEQARIHLARALAAQAPLLLLDEPVAALDPRHQLDAMGLFAEEAQAGCAVLAAIHDLESAARWCGRVVVLEHGRVAADGPPDMALSGEILSTVFGVRRDAAGRLQPT